MDKLSELTINAIKGWEKLVIFSGLCIFSLYIAGMVYYFIIFELISIFNLNLLIFFSIIIFILSYVAYRYFPGKFPHWNIKLLWKILKKSLRKKGTKSDVALISFIILFFPPFCGFFKIHRFGFFCFIFDKF